jgi:HD-like signal output (HDOD) protein
MPSQIERSADRNFILRHLPVFPAVALELIDLIDRRASDVAVITRMLGRDPGLSAEVLRQANSALSSPRKTVSDLSDAVNRLGADQTCNVAMKAACRGLVSPALGRPELRSCWERCVASAILASALAPELGFVAGQAYTAGLLHDIGCLALVAVYPDRYLEALQNMRDGAGWL